MRIPITPEVECTSPSGRLLRVELHPWPTIDGTDLTIPPSNRCCMTSPSPCCCVFSRNWGDPWIPWLWGHDKDRSFRGEEIFIPRMRDGFPFRSARKDCLSIWFFPSASLLALFEDLSGSVHGRPCRWIHPNRPPPSIREARVVVCDPHTHPGDLRERSSGVQLRREVEGNLQNKPCLTSSNPSSPTWVWTPRTKPKPWPAGGLVPCSLS